MSNNGAAPEQVARQKNTFADSCLPSTSAASAPPVPAIDSKEKPQSKGHGTSRGAAVLPRHMTKGIQINSPGPAYRAPGLKRPQGGKPFIRYSPAAHDTARLALLCKRQ